LSLNFSVGISSLLWLLVSWSVLVQLHEFGKIELRLLNDLGLSDHAVTEWENFMTLLLNFSSNIFFNQNFDKVSELVLLDSGSHDLYHLLSDHLFVRRFQVAGGFDLVLRLLGESNCEHSDDETISCLGLNEALDKGVPFLDHLAGMIPGDVNSVEISVTIKSLHFLNLELNLSVGVWVFVLSSLVAVAVSKIEGENTPFQTISGIE